MCVAIIRSHSVWQHCCGHGDGKKKKNIPSMVVLLRQNNRQRGIAIVPASAGVVVRGDVAFHTMATCRVPVATYIHVLTPSDVSH